MFFNNFRVWYVSKVLGVMEYDKKSFFENNVYIGSGRAVTIGKHCHINENVFIQGATIGDNVMIAPNVAILNSTHNHRSTAIPMINQGDTEKKNPVISSDVWIGRNAIILPGIKVAKGSIIAAGAVVTKDVKEFTVVGGVPAGFIKNRL